MESKAIHIYVAVNGNDSASGTKQAPLATLEGARKKLEELGHQNGAVVTFSEGVYNFDKSVLFEEKDSGTSGNPVVYEAEGNVVFSGGISVSSDKIKGVTDEAMAKRLPCADIVKAVDLSGLGFNENTIFSAEECQPRFFAGDKGYENARYPNREKTPGVGRPYLRSKRVIVEPKNDKGRNEIKFYYDDKEVREHMAKWAPEAYEDMYIYGYFWHQWNYCIYKGERGSAEYGVITASMASCGYASMGETENDHRRQFISNVPEELDAEGEYYYDRKKSTLYFIPNDDFKDGMPVTVSVCKCNAVKLDNAHNIVFKGIKFSYFINTPIAITNSDDILFENCEISHSSDAAASVVNSANCRFVSCNVFDTACGGIYFDRCGDRRELINSGCAVENCIINDVNRVQTCYRPAVHFKNGCGLSVRNCELSDAPHALIILEHINDIVIEDNRIERACLDTDDASAIYWGRDPSDLGIVIRHNYIANVGHKAADYSISAIYIDDWATGCEVYNNIFYNCGILSGEKMSEHTNANSIVLNNAQFLNAHNNIFIGTYQDQKPTNLYPCPSFARWINMVNGIEAPEKSPSEGSWYKVLEDAGFMTETWKNHYKNTAWAIMFDYVNADIQKRLSDYRKTHENESGQKVYVDIAWAVYNDAWDHVTEDGKKYDGTLYEYMKETYSDELGECFENYENNAPTEGSRLDGFLFWKAVRHQLKFRTTNTFVNNVSIGMDRAYLTEDEHLKGHVMNGFYQNYVPANDKLADGNSMFVKYGENFELTAEGIAEIHKHLPEFHNISMDGMGIQR